VIKLYGTLRFSLQQDFTTV